MAIKQKKNDNFYGAIWTNVNEIYKISYEKTSKKITIEKLENEKSGVDVVVEQHFPLLNWRNSLWSISSLI